MKYKIVHQNYFIYVRFNYVVKNFTRWLKTTDLFPISVIDFKEDTNDKNQVSL